MMDRRSFISTIVGALAIQRLGLPKVRAVAPMMNFDELNAITLREVMPLVSDNFFQASPLLQYLRSNDNLTMRGHHG